jgi:membrane protease subunit HflK
MRYLRYALGLLLVAYLLTGVVQVRPGERAVVRRFGRVVAQPGPGLWVGFPWGIDRVDRVPVDLVRRVPVGYQPEAEDSGETTPNGQLLTGDQNLVNVQVVIDYAVDRDAVEDYVVQADRADALVARAAEAVLTEWVAGHTVDDVLITGKGALPAVLVEQTQARVEPYRLGVHILAASVAYLLPPDEVRRDFDEVTRAQTAIRTREDRARAEANDRLWKAQAEKFRIEQDTAAYRNERLRLAQAEAAAFEKRLEQYHRLRQQNPDILTAIWWDEMGKLFTRLRDNGRIDVLDNYLGAEGLDITQFAPQPKKK